MSRYNAARYLPLDELLDRPFVKLLRAIRHFSWATLPELMEALDEADYGAHWHAIDRLRRDGHIERDTSSVPHRYRITTKGRQHLEQLLSRTLIDEQL